MNVLGGAVAIGHPLGASGARIVQSLMTNLQLKKGRYGLAGVFNGCGGSTAIIIENV
jgi:acetyl-CoA C-acetyltransferase